MKRLYCGLLVAACLTGCADEKRDKEISGLRIVPRITRVTGLHFDPQDRIGLTVDRPDGEYVSNRMMTYDGSFFTASDFQWYGEKDVASTLTAYYPYDETGFPAEFSVAADQRAGCSGSNLLVAVKTDVRPTSAAVGMTFRSLMSDILIAVANQTEASVTKVTVTGAVVTAAVDLKGETAVAKSGVEPGEITAFAVTEGSAYEVIVVPQRAALTFTVHTNDGERYSKTLAESLFESNKQYTLAVTVTPAGLELTLSGEIVNWEPGGDLGANEAPVLEYQGERYRTAEVDGKIWMAENMRHLPSQELIDNGVWYPSQSGIACTDAAYVRAKGLLYDYATATGGTASAGAVVQGICPDGWHLPDQQEIASLLTASLGEDFIVCAGFWNAVRNQYGTETKGYLVGISEDQNGSRNYLTLENGMPKQITPISASNGVSVRCVKDA